MVHLARKVLKNSIYNSSSVFISKFGGLIFTIILARLLLPELFGVYHLALAVGLMLLTFTDLGINGTLIRYVSHAVGKNDEDLASSYFRYLFKLKFILVFLSSLSLILLANPLALHLFHKPDLSLPLQIVGIFLFFQSFLDFVEAGFISMQRFEYSTIRHIVYEGLRLILVPALILLGFSVFGALAGLSISTAATLLVLTYFLLKNYPFLLKGKTVKIERRRILRFLSYLTIGSISGVFFAYVDSIMLGIFMPVEYVGFYRAGYNIVFAFAGLVSIAGVLFPVFTQLEGDELENAFKKVFKYSSILSFPCAFGLLFIAEPVIRVVYGIDYLPAVLPTYILSLLIIIAPLDFFGTLFNAKEKPEYPAKLIIISSTLNTILNYFLILQFGMAGAAVATVISRYFNITSLGFLSRKVLNVFPSLDTIYKPLFSSSVMVLFFYLVPRPNTILIGLGEILMATIIYISVMFSMGGIEKEDIKYLGVIVGQEERLIKAYNFAKGELGRGNKRYKEKK